MTNPSVPLHELWATSHTCSPTHFEYYALPVLIREAYEHRTIPREEVALWPTPNAKITLSTLCALAFPPQSHTHN
ncbi:MAG: hypothetical protein JWM95_1049 [Gemmatimonadetes bacterium]|nr:hypothetical protein [Gemmatimonadota bacterium]